MESEEQMVFLNPEPIKLALPTAIKLHPPPEIVERFPDTVFN
jgi:hypothetical protein